jgi:hypothetical protein
MVDVMTRRAFWVRPPSALRRGSQLRIGKETVVVYVGIDLHRRTSHVAAFDEEGLELLSRRVTNDPEVLRAIFAELGGEGRVALEAAFGWEWLADLLEAEGIESSRPRRSCSRLPREPGCTRSGGRVRAR